MGKAYGYIRVSTKTQAEHGNGLDVQRKAIEQYATDNGLTLEKIFEDAGISGTKESRPALDELVLETIQAGDIIIVHNTSRLWRDIFAQATIMKAVTTVGAFIKSIDDPDFDIYSFSHDPGNFMITSMMGMLDQWERMTITRKLARGRASKASKGDKPSGVCPFGYEYSADKKSVVINQAEAQTVKRMFSLAQCGTSIQSIAQTLEAEGVTNRKGKPFGRSSIYAILDNRFYIGELTHTPEPTPDNPTPEPVIYQGNQTPIISKVQFGKVQSKLHSKAKR